MWDWVSVFKLIPAVLGSGLSMLWLKDAPRRRFLMFLGGVAIAKYLAPYTSTVTTMDERGSMFFLGLFGTSIVASVFETWSKLDFIGIIKEKLKLKPPHSTEVQE